MVVKILYIAFIAIGILTTIVVLIHLYVRTAAKDGTRKTGSVNQKESGSKQEKTSRGGPQEDCTGQIARFPRTAKERENLRRLR